jgi:hypothetical protein
MFGLCGLSSAGTLVIFQPLILFLSYQGGPWECYMTVIHTESFPYYNSPVSTALTTVQLWCADRRQHSVPQGTISNPMPAQKDKPKSQRTELAAKEAI